jgi:plasmid rolling circle replication initiator protein Rep
MELLKSQAKNYELLEDKSSTGRLNPWKEKKMGNELLSKAYDSIGNDGKSSRLRECATWLKFRRVGAEKKLQAMNCCRVRLCPVCTWRRSLRVYAHMRGIMAAMAKDKYRYIFVTLTIRNCSGDELSDTMTSMSKAWDLFMKYKPVKKAVKGYYRGTEVTHNLDYKSECYDTYHPHFHCVFAVNESYFTSRDYIKQADWAELWQKAMRLDYKPNVDVRRVKGADAKAVAEAAKYTLKESDYLIPDDWDMTTKTVQLLDSAFEKRRFVAFGGVMKEWHKKLNLDDTENGDLVNVEGGPPESDTNDPLVTYVWYTGYKQYIKASEE